MGIIVNEVSNGSLNMLNAKSSNLVSINNNLISGNTGIAHTLTSNSIDCLNNGSNNLPLIKETRGLLGGIA